MLNKIKSVIIGHAIGDALGVPVEFITREELKEKPVVDMQGNGTYPVPKGSWSDDTSMSLATLDSLSHGINYEDIMNKFGKWLNNAEYTPTGEVFDVGKTVLKSVLLFLQSNVKALDCGQKSELDNGNGSLMRINPIVLYLYDKKITICEKIEIIHNVSALTHGHMRSKVACGIYAFVLWELLKIPLRTSINIGLQKAKEYYKGNSELKYYNRLFDIDFVNTSVEEIKSSGYVVDSLEASIWCLLTTDNYKDCVLKAVNLGDDTDTIGAISGGLAGALYGYDSIPKKWRDTLIKREYIEELCEKLYEN